MQAVFAPVQFEQRAAPFLPAEDVARFDDAVTQVKRRIEENERRRKALEAGAQELLLKRHGVSQISELPREVVRDGVADEAGEQIRALRKRIEYYQRELQRYQPLSLSVSSGGTEKKIPTPDTHILIGGGLESPRRQGVACGVQRRAGRCSDHPSGNRRAQACPGPLDRQSIESADGARNGEPNLAASLRPRPGEDRQ